jgi:hypothetical protein
MTTTFDDRERAFEACFAHEEEIRFLALARRDKLFALWAADALGLAEPARAQMVHELLAVQGFPHHDEALLRFAAERLDAAGAHAAALAAPAELERLGKEAAQQVRQGDAKPVDLTSIAPR